MSQPGLSVWAARAARKLAIPEPSSEATTARAARRCRRGRRTHKRSSERRAPCRQRHVRQSAEGASSRSTSGAGTRSHRHSICTCTARADSHAATGIVTSPAPHVHVKASHRHPTCTARASPRFLRSCRRRAHMGRARALLRSVAGCVLAGSCARSSGALIGSCARSSGALTFVNAPACWRRCQWLRLPVQQWGCAWCRGEAARVWNFSAGRGVQQK